MEIYLWACCALLGKSRIRKMLTFSLRIIPFSQCETRAGVCQLPPPDWLLGHLLTLFTPQLSRQQDTFPWRMCRPNHFSALKTTWSASYSPASCLWMTSLILIISYNYTYILPPSLLLHVEKLKYKPTKCYYGNQLAHNPRQMSAFGK